MDLTHASGEYCQHFSKECAKLYARDKYLRAVDQHIKLITQIVSNSIFQGLDTIRRGHIDGKRDGA